MPGIAARAASLAVLILTTLPAVGAGSAAGAMGALPVLTVVGAAICWNANPVFCGATIVDGFSTIPVLLPPETVICGMILSMRFLSLGTAL